MAPELFPYFSQEPWEIQQIGWASMQFTRQIGVLEGVAEITQGLCTANSGASHRIVIA